MDCLVQHSERRYRSTRCPGLCSESSHDGGRHGDGIVQRIEHSIPNLFLNEAFSDVLYAELCEVLRFTSQGTLVPEYWTVTPLPLSPIPPANR